MVLLRFVIFAVMVLTSSIDARAADVSDLDASFVAALGHAAPLIRQMTLSTFLSKKIPGDSGSWPIVVQLTPDRLVRVDKLQWALIIKETVQGVGHNMGGAIGIAYLLHARGQWKSEQTWLELFYSGVYGQPANAAEQVKHFDTAPLYLATDEWCGMGICEDGIDAVSLNSSGPRYLGDILGGARSPAIATDVDLDSADCENYAYNADIGPPTIHDSFFSVIYGGWRSPPRKLTPKTEFRLVTDMVEKSGRLTMQPILPIPVCAR
jgi:hypothetical protein